MPITLILNQNNIVENSGNSSFLYNFPQGGYQFKDQFIAVQQISLYNSTFNISSANQNNSFSYIWVDGTVVNITLPDSYLGITEINAYMQSVMVDNGHYLISGTSYVYLLEIVVNPSRYADQINSYLISSTIATNNSWTLPPSATWVLPTDDICPMFVVPNTNFQQLIGYTAGNYPNSVIAGTPPAQTQTPAYTSTQSFLSSTAPQIVPQPYYLCICTLVNNRLAIPSQFKSQNFKLIKIINSLIYLSFIILFMYLLQYILHHLHSNLFPQELQSRTNSHSQSIFVNYNSQSTYATILNAPTLKFSMHLL